MGFARCRRPPSRTIDRFLPSSCWGGRLNTFEVIVDCGEGGNPHEHVVVVSSGKGAVVGASPPKTVRLQYVCPSEGTTRMMSFKPPQGLPRPYIVVSVT